VEVVNIHTKQKITKIKLRQNDSISTGKEALNTNKRPREKCTVTSQVVVTTLERFNGLSPALHKGISLLYGGT